ncbi:hypothetical protein AVEN_28144-1 [Araneus ventricosus]|uniref:Uncharacterized protein n=1 Tax=Araneus ventricosus TaxID=182803 RepID=A0A4Y2GG15_ARAVE|nr:hypothetical protein AVEN_28144-1 [Araneus ventricosus]
MGGLILQGVFWCLRQLLKPQKLKSRKSVPTVIKFSSGGIKDLSLLEVSGVTSSSLGIPGMRYIENSSEHKSTMGKVPLPRFFHMLSHRFSTHVSGKRRQFSKEPFCIPGT